MAHCVEKNIPMEKLNDIILNHHHKIEYQNNLKLKMEQEILQKSKDTKTDCELSKIKQENKEQNETLPSKFSKDFLLIFPEIPVDFINSKKVDMLDNLDGLIANHLCSLWKSQRQYFFDEMINRYPNQYKHQHLFLKVI